MFTSESDRILTPLLTITNPLAVHQTDHSEKEEDVGRSHIFFKFGGEQDGVSGNA